MSYFQKIYKSNFAKKSKDDLLEKSIERSTEKQNSEST